MIIQELKKKYKNKKILIVGLGLQGGGTGLVKFFSTLDAKVKVTDLKSKYQLRESINKIKQYKPQLILGRHDLKDFLWADIIFKGPSVPWDLYCLKESINKGIPVEMEASFFASVCPAKIIGVTGTRGKSTTTIMIYEILKQSKADIYIAGNLSNISTIALLAKIKKDDWVVLELSSQQLSGFHQKKISPHIAVFTNLYPDHLNYYKSMDDYTNDKKAIYLYQNPNDYIIIHESLLRYVNKLESKIITYGADDFPYSLRYLRGEHNRENAAAALQVADILHLNRKKSIQIISQFPGVPYRQQIIGKKNNAIFINDTTSTTPIATIRAIEAFQDNRIILILGGNTKNLPLNTLINQLIKVEKIVLLKGSFTEEILPLLKKKYKGKITNVHDNMTNAVQEAYNFARKSKKTVYVLFSPAATSFAMFNNEFNRGEEFNRIVKEVISNRIIKHGYYKKSEKR
jgi:UDP-N-acetylmuramoylalanine--D-glutamate ligase